MASSRVRTSASPLPMRVCDPASLNPREIVDASSWPRPSRVVNPRSLPSVARLVSKPHPWISRLTIALRSFHAVIPLRLDAVNVRSLPPVVAVLRRVSSQAPTSRALSSWLRAELRRHVLSSVVAIEPRRRLRIDREKARFSPMVASSLFAKQVPQLLVAYKSAQYFGMYRNDLMN
uniref:Uncharacterized protein n=1 Tax=Brassica campestris TaxID=3711 RepID=M4F5K2_BRACM|nr:unnamed protein product [Brassica rapa]